MNTATWKFEDSNIDQCVTAIAMLPVQMAMAVAWLVTWLVSYLASATQANWRPLMKLAAIVAVTLVVVSVWQIGVGVAVVVALTAVAKRKGKI